MTATWHRSRFACTLGLCLAACTFPVETPAEPSAYLFLRYDGGNGLDGYATDEDREDTWDYYARAAVGLGGQPGTTASPGVVPETLKAFKTQFNIPTRTPGEDVTAYRSRIGAAVYYNRHELGFGRELACSGPWDGGTGRPGFLDSDGESIGFACFVTNYAGGPEHQAFYDPDGAMANARSAEPRPKNTVAITYRPTQGEEEGTQFWVYGPDGALQDYAQLDDDGHDDPLDQARPVPSVCTECHGGHYVQDERGVAVHARFLPVNPVVVDTSGAAPGIQERFRRINCATRQGGTLTSVQREFFEALYTHDGGDICTPGQEPAERPVLEGWSDPHAADLWTHAVMPHCAACHMALEEPTVVPSYDALTQLLSYEQLMGDYEGPPTMPHAMPTWRELWTSGPVEALDPDGKVRSHDSPGAYLAYSMWW